MGRNIEMVGLTNVMCPICKEELVYLDEIDLDCDVMNHHPNSFDVYTTCSNCDNDVKIKFTVSFEVERN